MSRWQVRCACLVYLGGIDFLFSGLDLLSFGIPEFATIPMRGVECCGLALVGINLSLAVNTARFIGYI